jgi:hypothetical protein
MSHRLIPNPEEFRVFCEFGFSQLDQSVKIFYSCCVQCGLETIKDDMEGASSFLFATVDDLEHAGEDGELLFHHGVRTEDSEISSDAQLSELMVNVLRDQGMDVRWSGDPAQRLKVIVDKWSYRVLAQSLNEKIKKQDNRPSYAIDIPSGHEDYAIHVWMDAHKNWWYEVSSTLEEHVYERDTLESRSEVVQAALDLVLKLYLDMN